MGGGCCWFALAQWQRGRCGRDEMDQIGQAHLISHRPICKGPPWPFEIILEKRCLKAMFFSSINCQASPTLVFPCTYPSVNTAHLSPSVNTTNQSSACLQETIVNQSLTIFIVNQSLTIFIVNQSLARSWKTKNFQCFFSLFCFASFVNTCFGHSELRVCFSFL